MLAARLSGWLGPCDVAAIPAMCARVKAVGRRLAIWTPSVSILRIAMRGLCTGWRFQARGTRCRFGCDGGLDKLEHFAECPCLLAAVATLRRHMNCPDWIMGGRLRWETLLLIEGAPEPQLDILKAVMVDCIVHAHGHARGHTER